MGGRDGGREGGGEGGGEGGTEREKGRREGGREGQNALLAICTHHNLPTSYTALDSYTCVIYTSKH